MITFLIIFAAKYAVVIPALLFVWLGYRSKDKVRFLQVTVIVCALAFTLSRVASLSYDNPRPFMAAGAQASLVYHAPGNGFPSDHALLTGVLAAVAVTFSAYFGALLWVLALIVGAGRVLAGVHHTVDVLASFAIAIASAWLVQYALKRYFPRP